MSCEGLGGMGERRRERTPAEHVNAQCSTESPSLEEEVRWQLAAKVGDVEPIKNRCQYQASLSSSNK